MITLYLIHRKCTEGYKFTKSPEKINLLMYRDDIKQITKKKKKNEKEQETMIQTIRIYSQDMGIEFGMEICFMLIMRNGKIEIMGGMELQNRERIKKGKLQVVENIGSGHYQTSRDENEKSQKSTSDERESFSKPNSTAEISSKG